MRTTRKELNSLFETFIKLLDSPERKFVLDHNACYGGYVVVEIGESGCESNPFGFLRMNAREMGYALRYAIASMHLKTK